MIFNIKFWRITLTKNKLFDSKSSYFGGTKSENELLKYWQNSKEIRSILKFIFSIYKYAENNCVKEMKINDASFITEQPESKTIFEQKKSMIINSSDYNSNMNSFTPTHSSYNSKFTSTTCKTPTMKSKEGANFTHRGSVAYDYKNRIYSGFNNEQTNTNQENSILFNKSNNMTKYDKSITIEGEMNNDEDQKDHSTIKKRRKSRAERNQRKSKSKEKYSPLNSKNQSKWYWIRSINFLTILK